MGVPFRNVLQTCLEAACGAGAIIRRVHATGMKIMTKDGETLQHVESAKPSAVLTQADGQAQHFIVGALRKNFPNITIVGEEDSTEAAPEQPTDVSKAPEVPSFELAAEWEDLCVWVDPLDGTKEFACGRVENCSVLIGVSVKHKPVAGVVYLPFSRQLCWGAYNLGVFLGDQKHEPPVTEKKTVTLSYSNPELTDGVLKQLLDRQIVEEVLRFGGCGVKVLSIILGKSDLMLQAPGSSRWDICPTDALLGILGGKVVDGNGDVFLYDPNKNHENECGVLAARSPALLEQVVPLTRGVWFTPSV